MYVLTDKVFFGMLTNVANPTSNNADNNICSEQQPVKNNRTFSFHIVWTSCRVLYCIVLYYTVLHCIKVYKFEFYPECTEAKDNKR